MIAKCRACNEEGNVYCPLCQKVSYCSQKCRDYDWAVKHKSECKTEIQKRTADEFEIVTSGSLGRGSFGCVKLVRDRTNGLLYAMKMIEKSNVTIEVLKTEIRIQKRLQYPHIIQLFHSSSRGIQREFRKENQLEGHKKQQDIIKKIIQSKQLNTQQKLVKFVLAKLIQTSSTLQYTTFVKESLIIKLQWNQPSILFI